MKSLINYQRVPVRELRSLPIRENQRLRVLDYRLTSGANMTNGKPRTHGHGAVHLQDGYVLAVCIARDGDEWLLEVETTAFDEAQGCREQMNHSPQFFSPQLLADVYWAMQRRQISAEGRGYRRTVGRN